jgi:hypothetical protein
MLLDVHVTIEDRINLLEDENHCLGLTYPVSVLTEDYPTRSVS